jgi:hypothetical protein
VRYHCQRLLAAGGIEFRDGGAGGHRPLLIGFPGLDPDRKPSRSTRAQKTVPDNRTGETGHRKPLRSHRKPLRSASRARPQTPNSASPLKSHEKTENGVAHAAPPAAALAPFGRYAASPGPGRTATHSVRGNGSVATETVSASVPHGPPEICPYCSMCLPLDSNSTMQQHINHEHPLVDLPF